MSSKTRTVGHAKPLLLQATGRYSNDDAPPNRRREVQSTRTCDESNVSGSNGQDNSEVNAASLPLVQGPVNQSCRDQDGQAHEAATTGRSQYEATKKVRDDF